MTKEELIANLTFQVTGIIHQAEAQGVIVAIGVQEGKLVAGIVFESGKFIDLPLWEFTMASRDKDSLRHALAIPGVFQIGPSFSDVFNHNVRQIVLEQSPNHTGSPIEASQALNRWCKTKLTHWKTSHSE
jgi:hypothetical protein